MRVHVALGTAAALGWTEESLTADLQARLVLGPEPAHLAGRRLRGAQDPVATGRSGSQRVSPPAGAA
ncbi:hypothetical protein [Cellulomonas sp. RIT-PI-Y]|uniref:hypothetical protein n=1 Tax=Cellulomonas sp. RIT-PI-Y TaxID=3035297 RepID=UPI0021D8A088|nr:hypothetical protein [Cellulomonas sp. RIT-PI-Y]